MRFYNELNTQLKFMNGELRVYVMTDELPLRPWTYEDLKESFTQLIPGKKILIRGMDFIYNPSITREIKKISSGYCYNSRFMDLSNGVETFMQQKK